VFEQFRALAPARQLVLVAAAALLLSIVLGAGWYFLLRTSYETLFTDLRPADAATIVSDLEKRRIDYRLADGGSTVLVPSDKVDATRLEVMSTDLPLKGTVGFELFNKSDLGLTDFAQKINYQRALQGELERTIMSLDGVEAARVHLSLGEDRIFRDDRVPPKASVTIHMRKGAVLTESAAQGVQRLVAAAVPQLDATSVVILDEEGQVVSATASAPAAPETLSPAMEEKKAVEEYYEAKIREALDASFSIQSIQVRVAANIAVASNGEAVRSASPPIAGVRDFGLKISLAPLAALPQGWEETARAVVSQAVGTSSLNDDEIAFGRPTEATPQAPAENTVPSSTERSIDASGPLAIPAEQSTWVLELAMALIPVLVVIALFFLLRRARPRRLSERQKSDLAAKLRTVLERGEAHATEQL
jgi:flagellar M-ring protein FliF